MAKIVKPEVVELGFCPRLAPTILDPLIYALAVVRILKNKVRIYPANLLDFFKFSYNLGHKRQWLPRTQGFDEYFGILYSNDMFPVQLIRNETVVEYPVVQARLTHRKSLESVTIVSTKKPEALSGAPGFADWEDRQIDEPTVIFEGQAIDAVDLFPANVNVAATISLAGIGPQKTMVKVVADPNSPGNVHEVEASGAFGQLSFKFVNKPHSTNPKTSYLAVLAAIEALRSYCEAGPRIGT